MCSNAFSSENSIKLQLYIVYMGEKKHGNPLVVTASHNDMLHLFLGGAYLWLFKLHALSTFFITKTTKCCSNSVACAHVVVDATVRRKL
jgi:hypothetical protein